MFRQPVFMLVANREYSEEILARIRSKVNDGPLLTRAALSLGVCAWMGSEGVDGQPKDMICRMALLKLGGGGNIDRPAARVVSFAKPVKVLDETATRKKKRRCRIEFKILPHPLSRLIFRTSPDAFVLNFPGAV